MIKRALHTRIAPVAIIVAAAAFAGYACSDLSPLGDPDLRGRVVVRAQPTFESPLASSVIPLSRARIVLRRADGSIVVDTLISFPGGVAPQEFGIPVQSASLTGVAADVLSNPLIASQVGSTATLALDLISPTGVMQFSSSLVSLPFVSGIEPPPVEIPVRYVGPGSSASTVQISPNSATLDVGANLDLIARALDGAGADQPAAPVYWTSLDPSVASVASPVVGRAVALTRGSARIRAMLLNGATSEATISVTAQASNLVLQSGSGQSGGINTPASQPLVARVSASDGSGVGGVTVAFAVQSGGGTLSASSANSDANGLASVGYTFGATPGPVAITASVAGLTGSPVTFNLTATLTTGSQLAFVSQPINVVARGTLPPVNIEARDATGLRMTTFTGPITIRLETVPAGVQLLGTLTRNAVGGTASFTGLSVSAPATALRLAGTATGITNGATSNAFDVTPRPAASLVFTAQPVNLAAFDPLPTLIVQARDDLGGLASTYNGTVTLGFQSTPAGATLIGPLTAVAVNGVASFAGLSVSAQATSARISATGTGITGTVLSNSFSVSAPTNPLVGAPPTTNFTVQRTAPSPAPADVQLTSNTSQVTGLTLGATTYGSGASGWLVASLNSTSTPSTLTLTATTTSMPEGTFTARVPVTGSIGANLSYFVSVTVTPLPVSQMVVITEPAGAVSGTNFVTQPVVELRDATGARVLTGTNTVTAAIATGAGTLGGTVARAAVQGRATFTDLRITGVGAHTLAFTSPGLPTVTSASVNVGAALTTTQAVAATSANVGLAVPAFVPVTAAGGVAPYTFVLSGGGLPAGMTFSATTGQLSGTPSAAMAIRTYTVTVTDATSAASSKTFTLTVNAALSTTLAVPSRAGTINRAITPFAPVTASGGTTPYTFALSGATLPAGLTFNTANGQVGGTPTATLGTTTFTVTATDGIGATSSKNFTLTINPALVATQAIASRAGTVNTPLPPFTPVTASGGTTPYTYALSGGTLPTGMSFSTTTGQISGTPTGTLATTTFTVTITDLAGATASQTFSLTVNSALTTLQAVAATVGTAGTPLATFTPVTASGGTLPYAFALTGGALPTGLAFSTTTGAISGTPTTPLAVTTFTVTVTDGAGATSSKTFTLRVNGPLTTTQAISSRSGTVGTAMTAFIPVTAAGGTTPYAFALTPPATLPTGLAFNTTTGQISGTPTATLATTTFTVTVTDGASGTSSKTFDLTVNSALTTTQAVASATGVVNTAITPFTPVTAAGGTAPYAFALTGTLPPGLTFNTGTGQITGTPTAVRATTTYTVTVTDAASATSSKTFTLAVNAALATTQVIPSRTGTVNTAIPTFTPVTATGGVAPYTFALSGGTLPTGMTLNTATGAISGTPTTTLTATTFTVTVTDAATATSAKTFSLTVNPALVATQAIASRVGTVGAAIAPFTPVTASGGTTPYTFTISGSLPAGLTLSSSTGQISGTPSAPLTATTFTVTVTDAATATATQTFTLTVNGALTTTQAQASTTTNVGTPVNVTPVTAAGGTTPYAFALTGTLPTGLNFNTGTGAITGTPTSSLATTTFTVTVTDAASATSSKTFVLTVNGPFSTTQAVPSRAGTVGTTIPSFTPVTAAGGTIPYSFALTPPGTLPTGMTFSTTTGQISGTPTATLATTTFTVTVTDATSATSSKTFTLTVNSALVTTQAVPSSTGVVNRAITPFTPVTASGGTAPYTFALSGGTLPPGLSFNTGTGQITGTPTAPLAATNYTVTATDAASATSSKTFSLTVNPAFTTTLAAPNVSASVNVAMTPAIPVTASGGLQPYAYAISAGLPAGLSFNTSTGQLSGMPTATLATTTFTVTVTDAGAVSSSRDFSLTVNPESPGIRLTLGAAATATVTAGSTISIPVLIDMSNRGSDDLGAITVDLAWDASRFSFNASSSIGTWPGGGFIIPGAPGSATISVAGFAPTGATTNFTLYTLVLNAIGPVGAPVNSSVTATLPSNAPPTNELGSPITVTVRGLTVTINP
ncbi:MAG TPA: putative Ig domain-containing protein [Gemmatimonadaceae bacterium]|nr:putative Ig domain-containing protein [Gemmatimonadaceae bacterium]